MSGRAPPKGDGTRPAADAPRRRASGARRLDSAAPAAALFGPRGAEGDEQTTQVDLSVVSVEEAVALGSESTAVLEGPVSFGNVPTVSETPTLARAPAPHDDEHLSFGSLPTISDAPAVSPPVAAAPAPVVLPAPAPAPPGLGRCGGYTLVERIKLGGMAEVFLARTDGPQGFQKQVAIKRILPHLASQKRFVQMFIDEAKLTVLLSHANIAQVYELGKDADTYFMAMEYIHGRDADWMFAQATHAALAAPLSVVCHVMEQVLEGLDYAHRRVGPNHTPLRIIHRDVSPNNVLITFDGGVKLIDFGIAKAATNLQEATQQGVIKGKAAYMSPEQLRGDSLDHRTDVFAGGIVFHELLTGRRLFRGTTDLQTIKNVLVGPIPPVGSLRPGVPADVAAVVHRCLERDVSRRYAWAGDAASALRDAQVKNGLLDGRAELVRWLRQLDAVPPDARRNPS